MLKHKKFLFLSLLLPIFMVFSCAKPKEPYPIVKNDASFSITISKKRYENGQKLKIDSVFYNTDQLTWAKKDYKAEGGYFICTNPEYPTNTIVAELTMTTNVEENSLKFYVGHFDNDAGVVHLSKENSVTIHNGDAIKPWVWYVVTGVVVFAVVGMIVFTKKRKANREK